MATTEVMNGGTEGEPASYDGWLSGVWFFLPHMDLRLDGIYSALGSPGVAERPPAIRASRRGSRNSTCSCESDVNEQGHEGEEHAL